MLDNMKRHVIWDNLMSLFNTRQFDEAQDRKAEAIGLIAATSDDETVVKLLAAIHQILPDEHVAEFHADPTTNESVLAAQAKLAEQAPVAEPEPETPAPTGE